MKCVITSRTRRRAGRGGRVAGQPVPGPYGTWYLEAMDAHGGWIASAIDLVRFASRVQRGAARRVSQERVGGDGARPPGTAGARSGRLAAATLLRVGMVVRPVGSDGRCNLWHTGLFSGSSTILVIRHDGLCWAVLFNTSATADGEVPSAKIDPLVHQAADAVRTWPAHDQFPAWLKF